MSSPSLPTWKRTEGSGSAIVAGMVTKIRKGARLHYYIKEHMEARNLSDEKVAARMGLSSRASVWKLYNEPHRLTPAKIQRIADALEMHTSELLFPPGVPSLDAIAADAPPERREMAADVLRRVLGGQRS